MAYTIYKADGTPVVIADATVDQTYYDPNANGVGIGLGTQLVGRNETEYDVPIAEGMTQLMSNFAGTILPSDSTSLIGQLWFDYTTKKMHVKVSTAGSGIANWEYFAQLDNSGDLTVPGDLTVNGTLFGGNTSGNATTASKLQTPRTISMTGDATWSVVFDGSADVTDPLTLAPTGVTAGTYGSTTTIPIININSKGYVFTATTAAKQTTYTGDISGTGTGSVAVTLASTGVSAGAYTNTNITVDAKGRITSASSGAPPVSNGDFTGANQSLGNPGYQKFPGGLIVQWGYVNTPLPGSGSTASATFPIAFSQVFEVIPGGFTNTTAGDGPSFSLKTISNTGFVVANADNTAINAFAYVATGI